MGKILGLVVGVIALVLGIIALVAWVDVFVIAVKALVMVVLICGGAIAVFLSIIELKDSLGIGKEKVEEIKQEAEKESAEEKSE